MVSNDKNCLEVWLIEDATTTLLFALFCFTSNHIQKPPREPHGSQSGFIPKDNEIILAGSYLTQKSKQLGLFKTSLQKQKTCSSL